MQSARAPPERGIAVTAPHFRELVS